MKQALVFAFAALAAATSLAETRVALWPEGKMPDRQAVQTNAPYMVWHALIGEVDSEPCHVNWAIPVCAAYVLSDMMDGSSLNPRGCGNELSVPLLPYLKFDGKMCPMCFFCGDADWWTMRSVRVYNRLRTMDISAELHTFVKERHCSMRDPKPGKNAANWKYIV